MASNLPAAAIAATEATLAALPLGRNTITVSNDVGGGGLSLAIIPGNFEGAGLTWRKNGIGKNWEKLLSQMLSCCCPVLSDLDHLSSCKNFFQEKNPPTLVQGLETILLDLGEVNEDILTTSIRGDEAEPLFVVEELDGTGLRHDCAVCKCRTDELLF